MNSDTLPSNVTSQASVKARIKVWLEGIPFVTRIVFFVCVAIYLLELIFGSITRDICLSPTLVKRSPIEFYRAFTSPFFHLGILHLVMNMMAFLPMATAIERKQGSLSLANLVVSFSFLNGLLHVIISLILYYSSIYKTRSCSAGLSGVIFSLLIVEVSFTQNPTQSIFGLFEVPTKVYPWALLIVLQLLMPKVSFVGHLSGIISGYIYVYGYMKYLTLSQEQIALIEKMPFMSKVMNIRSYVVGQETGLLPTSINRHAASSSFSLSSYMSGLFSSSGGSSNSNSTSSSSSSTASSANRGGHVLGEGSGFPPIPVIPPPTIDGVELEPLPKNNNK